MHSSLFYLPGALLSQPELSSARLDGLLVEVGEGYMPSDLPEDASARMRSLAHLISPGYAASGPTAAWVHGIGDAPPESHHVQRVSARRPRVPRLRNVVVHEQRLGDDDVEVIAVTPVTTRLRTLTDLVLRAGADPASAQWMHRFARADSRLVPQVRSVIETWRRVPGRRAALAALASLDAQAGDEQAQEDVTR